MNKRITSILALCAASSFLLHAQEVRLGLDECLRLGMENDAAVRNSRLDLQAAKEQLGEARWEFLPRLTASTFGYWSLNPMIKVTVKDVLGNSDAANEINNRIQEFAGENGIRTAYTTLKEGWGASATIFQPIYAGGRIVNGNRLAELGVEAAGIQSRIREKYESGEIERKYWAAVALQEKMNTLLQAMSLLDSLSKDADAAIAAGLMVPSDAREIRDRKNELKAAHVKLKGGLRLSKMDLFNSVGYRYEMLSIDGILLSDRLDTLNPPSSYISPDGADCRSDESELLSIQVKAKELERKMSVGESLPQLMVGANCSYSNMMGNDHFRRNLVGFVSLQIPVTDIGKAAHRSKRLGYEVQKARNDREYLDAQLVLRRQMLQLEMETAWDSLQLSLDKEKSAREDVSRAESEFRSGRTAMSDLLRSELDLRTACEASINSRIDYRNAVRAYLDVR